MSNLKTDEIREDYKSAAKRLMKMILSSGDGQALKDLKILMDSRSETLNEIDRLRNDNEVLQTFCDDWCKPVYRLEQRTKEACFEAGWKVIQKLMADSQISCSDTFDNLLGLFKQAIDSAEVTKK